MSQDATAARYLPGGPGTLSLATIKRRATACEACPLYRRAQQTIFGEGPADARLMLIGEQPGDSEDRAGRPFVGPAGRLLDQALAAAGIARQKVYVTNVVKHFKWTGERKRRLHAKPNLREIQACRPWLEAELAHIQPTVVVALGATAAQALAGRGFRVSRERGRLFRDVAGIPQFFATIHPSAILRGPSEDRAEAIRRLVADLRRAARQLSVSPRARGPIPELQRSPTKRTERALTAL